MSIRDMKITDAQINEKGVISSPDTLNGTAAENKSVFDRLTREIVAPQFNAIVDTFADMEESTNKWSSQEDDRQQAESDRGLTEALRKRAEADRVTAETARTQAEASRVEAEKLRRQSASEMSQLHSSVIAHEKERIAWESGRGEAESLRRQAETERAQAEASRAEAETKRVDSENLRAQAEAVRVEAESKRVQDASAMSQMGNALKSNEADRVAQENARRIAENQRQEAEDARDGAENDRMEAEQGRIGEEEYRMSLEKERVRHENGRVLAETARVEAETARAEAETKRNDAENQRAQAEAARTEAETAREDAENYRTNSEQERVDEEENRDFAETSRVRAENRRVQAENERASLKTALEQLEGKLENAEDSRVQAEAGRLLAETTRVEAETARENTVNQLKDDTAALSSKLEKTEKRAARAETTAQYAIKLQQGYTYDCKNVVGSGSEIDVPVGAKDYAGLRKIGGMSRKGYQLLPDDFPASSYQLNVTKNGSYNYMLTTLSSGGYRQSYKRKDINGLAGMYTLRAEIVGTGGMIIRFFAQNGEMIDQSTITSTRLNNTFNISKDFTEIELLFIGNTNKEVPIGSVTTISSIMLESGNTAHHFEPYAADLIVASIDSVVSKRAGGEVIHTTDLPTEMLALCPDYGQGTAESYNYIDFEAKSYHHVGSMDQNGIWTALDTTEIIDLSTVWPDELELLTVESGGTVQMHYPKLDEGFKLAVPSEIVFAVDIAQAVKE